MKISAQDQLKLDQVVKMAQDICDYYLEKDLYTVTVNKRYVNKLGTTRHLTKSIELSALHILSDSLDDVLDTILHEIAHALCGAGNGHNTLWAKVCIGIGARPQAKNRPAIVNTKHLAGFLRYKGEIVHAFKRPNKLYKYLKRTKDLKVIHTIKGQVPDHSQLEFIDNNVNN